MLLLGSVNNCANIKFVKNRQVVLHQKRVQLLFELVFELLFQLLFETYMLAATCWLLFELLLLLLLLLILEWL